MTVLRHEHGVDVAQGAVEAIVAVDRALAGLEHRSGQLRAVFDEALRACGLLAARDSDSPELDRMLRLACQVGATWLRCVAAAPGAAVGAQIGDVRYAFAGVGRDDEATVARFREVAALAAVTRDRSARRELARLPLSAVASEGGARVALGLLRVRAWQGLLRQAVGDAAVPLDWMGVLEAAYKAANAVRTRTAADRETQSELEAMRALALGDPREVNRALGRMLDAFGRGCRDGGRREDPRTFLALPVLAIGAVAKDTGLRVEVDSEYTPLRLFQGQFDEIVEDTSTQDRVVLCPFCGSSLPKRARACPRCASDLSQSEPIVGDPARIAGLERGPCGSCGESMLTLAHVCPSCLRWRDGTVGVDEATDEVALRPFPPAYQAWLSARRAEPSRLRLPRARAAADVAAAWLRRAGLSADAVPSAPGLVDVRLPGDVAAAGFEITAADGGLEVETTFGVDPTRDLWRLVRVAQALSGGGGAIEPALGEVWSAERLAQIAESPVPPDPELLFGIAVHRSPDGARAWLTTRGLSRCGVFDLELLDVPVADVDRFVALLRTVALRLVERDEGLWPEEVPFQVGEGLWVSWIPLQWARDEWPAAYGSGPERASEGGAESLSGVIVASEPRGRREPIATLADRLRGGARLWASTLALRRLRSVARVTWPRLEALRRERPDDPVEVEIQRYDGEPTSLAEPLRARLVRREGDRIVIRGPSGDATWPADAVLDWTILGPGGRVTAIESLARRAGSGERLAAARPTEPEEHTDPRFAESGRMDGEPEPTVVTLRRPDPGVDGEEITRPSTSVPLPPALPSLPPHAVERTDGVETAALLTETGEVTVTFGRVPIGVVLASLVIPGLGHWWIGERNRGAWVLAAAVVTLGGCGLIGLWAAWDLWTRDR